MLDLGFLEDVEKILALTPNGRQTALFSATMPPPIRKLADRYLYDPVTSRSSRQTLTVDTVEQFQLEVSAKDKAEKLVEVLRGRAPDQAIVFVRTKIRCDQLYRKLRDKGMNVKALHGDMSQGSRDGVMLVVQGRPRADPRRHRRRRPRPRHLDRHPRRQLRRADLPRRLRPPHRPHRPRRALGPRDHVRRAAPEARARGDRAATSARRSRRGAPGAHDRAGAGRRSARAATPSRSITRNGDEPRPSCSSRAGRADGLEVADLVHAVTAAAGVDGEAVRDVRVLERFSLLSVPGRRRSARSSTPSTGRRSAASRCASSALAPDQVPIVARATELRLPRRDALLPRVHDGACGA